MHRLLDSYLPLFAFGLELDLARAAGRAPAAPQAQHEAAALLQRARGAAMAAGRPPAEVEQASFAVVAWLDDIIAGDAAWSRGLTPLQAQLFNSSNASTEFFHHLAALPADQAEVREIYWYAMALGFAGHYYFERGDEGELGKLKTLHGQQLPVAPLSPDTLVHDHITPQPYATPDPPGPRAPDGRQRALLRFGAAMVLVVPLAWLLWTLLAGPRDAAPTLAQGVEHLLQSYACADLSATVAPDGRTRVSGFVSQPQQIESLRREVTNLPGVRSAEFALQLRIWPHCEVMAILKPYQARNRELHAGLEVRADSARDGKLREGDPVRLRVTNPDYESYLWVDYYTADGSVLHFFAGRGPVRTRSREQVELGQDTPSSWLVSPPFGAVMATALTSPLPFAETTQRPPFELASDYLLHLREALAVNKGSDKLVADIVFLETVER